MNPAKFLAITPSKLNTRKHSDRTALLVIYFSTVIIFSNMYAPQPLLPEISRDFGISPSEAGLIISALVLTVAVSAMFYGYLSDRIGRRPVLIGSSFLLVIPTLLCAIAPNYPALIAFRAAQGFALPGFISTILAFLYEEFPGRSAALMSVYTAATVVGGFNGRFMAGIMGEFFDWRFTFFAFAGLDLLSAILLWRFLPASSGTTRLSQALPSKARGSMLASLRNPRLVATFLTGMAIFYTFVGFFTYVPYYLVKAPFNLPTMIIGVLFVVNLVGVVSAPLSNRLAERFGRREVMLAGMLAMAGGALLTLVPLLPVVFIAMLVLCYGMFTVQASCNAYIGDCLTAHESYGSTVSMHQMFFYGAGTVAGFLPGIFWQSGGWLPVIASFMVALGTGYSALNWLGRSKTVVSPLIQSQKAS